MVCCCIYEIRICCVFLSSLSVCSWIKLKNSFTMNRNIVIMSSNAAVKKWKQIQLLFLILFFGGGVVCGGGEGQDEILILEINDMHFTRLIKTHARRHTHSRAGANTQYTHTHIGRQIHHTSTLCTKAHTYTQEHIHMHIHAHIRTHTLIQKRAHIHICTHAHTHIHTHIHTRARTYTHTHTHIQTHAYTYTHNDIKMYKVVIGAKNTTKVMFFFSFFSYCKNLLYLCGSNY